MQTLTQQMTPRCVGRYLIDLPADMKPGLIFGSKVEGIDILIKPMAEAFFRTMLAQREAELRSAHMDGEPAQLQLKEIIPLGNGEGKIFNRAEGGLANALRILELHGWRDGYAIKMWIDAFDNTYPEDRNDAWAKQRGNETPQKQAALLALYARTRGRADTEVPTEPGVCFQYGFVQGTATDKEDISLDYVLRPMPDVVLHFESDSGLVTDTTLLDRSADIEAGLKEAEGHVVHAGKRTSKGDVAFEESLSAGRTTDYVMGHMFNLEANSKIGSAKTPLLNIDFYNGSRESPPDNDLPGLPPLAKASLSEAETLALWDAITATLRPRPGGF